MSHFFNYKKTKVHYSTQGKGSTIVLLHGFLENLTMWHFIGEKLAEKHRVICIDLLGHGKTENLGYIHSMDEQAFMVKALLTSLRLRKYTIIGHSMGGYVGLSFANKFPKNVKALCLMNSTALPDTKEKKLNRDRGISAVKQNHKTFIRIAIPMLFSESNRTKYLTEIKSVTNEALKTSTQGIIAALEGMKTREDLTNVLKSNEFPISMVIGKEDPALDYKSLKSQLKGTKVLPYEFPDGHMSHIENKNELVQVLQEFTSK